MPSPKGPPMDARQLRSRNEMADRTSSRAHTDDRWGARVLFLACLSGRSGRAKKLPDRLLEVFYPGQKEPELYLVEVSTYPERRAEEQALADAILVYLDRGRLPEVLTLVLCPRGLLRVGSERAIESPRGWTRFRANWRVVELWELSAADLLAMNDVGLGTMDPTGALGWQTGVRCARVPRAHRPASATTGTRQLSCRDSNARQLAV